MARRRLGLGLAAGLVVLVAAAAGVQTWRTISTPTVSAERGAALFATSFTPAQGLGPLFNNTSCLACHNTPSPGGSGSQGLATVLRVGQLSASGFNAMAGHGGPVARAHSVAELGVDCTATAGVPVGANLTSVRNAPPLFGDGRIDTIPDAAILAAAVPRGDGIQGRPNMVGERVGRFGWKADTADLLQFVGEAFRNELGITTPQAPIDLVPSVGCGGASSGPEADATQVESVTAYVASLPSPPYQPGDATAFNRIGCTACHVPSLAGVPLYSDLLLHNMGGTLDDGVIQGLATGHDWRTAPLWGLSQRSRYLHDGRARTLDAAILAHGGEAAPVIERYRALAPADRAALLAFLGTL